MHTESSYDEQRDSRRRVLAAEDVMGPGGLWSGWSIGWGATLFLCAGGLYLLITGALPRRQGATRYCRKCGYDLTGTPLDVESARCSECGEYLRESSAVVVGKRRVPRGRVAVGFICLLLGGTPWATLWVGTVLNVDWYTYTLTDQVLSDAASDDIAVVRRAWSELKRRVKLGRLSAEQTSRLIDICLAEQARPTFRPSTGGVAADLLDRYRSQGQLTAVQARCFLNNLIVFALEVHPREEHPTRLDVDVVAEHRGPRKQLSFDITLGECRISGDVERTLPDQSRRCAGALRSGDLIIVGTVETLVDPGSFGITQDFTWRVFDARSVAQVSSLSVPLHSGQGTISTEHKVPVTDPALFRLIHSPELDQAVADCVRVSPLAYLPAEAPAAAGRQRLWGVIEMIGPRPTGLAFDVAAEFDTRRVEFGAIAFPKGGRTWNQVFGGSPDMVMSVVPERVTIVLRSNRELALRTPGMDEIWDGELRFEGVTLGALDAGNWAAMPKVYRAKLVQRGPRPPEMNAGDGPAAASQPAEP